MINTDEMIKKALAHGFSQAGGLNMDSLIFMPEIRDMCNADRCGNYGKSWSCPPGCGTIEASFARIKGYSCGVIVQTIGQMEDDFDYDTIADAGKKHIENFAAMLADLKSEYGDVLGMGAGTCRLCEKCTYPDAPCRNPDKMVISMEAYGLWVSKVCELSGIAYNNGKQTITYTSCYLFK